MDFPPGKTVYYSAIVPVKYFIDKGVFHKIILVIFPLLLQFIQNPERITGE